MKKIINLTTILLVSSLSICSWAEGRHGKKLKIFADGQTSYKIVVSDKANSTETFAARELQRYIRSASGIEMPIIRDTGKGISGHGIYVMLRQHAPQSIALNDYALGEEGFAIKTFGSNLYLAGARNRGVLYAVYRFLQDYLGVRYYCYDDERIPKLSTLILNEINRVEKPAFPYRGLKGWNPVSVQWHWMSKMGMNYVQAGLKGFKKRPKRYPAFVAEKKKYDMIFDLGGHYILHYLLPPEKYFKKHPEWYSLILKDDVVTAQGDNYFEKNYNMSAGNRKPKQICSSSPGARKELVKNFLKLVRQYPEAEIYSPWFGDGMTFCQCPSCLEKGRWRWLDLHPACQHWVKPAWVVATKQLLQLVNPLAEAMAREFPAKKVFTIAYVNTSPPPKTVMPDPNLNIQFATWHRCYKHALDFRGDKNCHEVNAYFDENLRNWVRACNGDVIIYYYACAKSAMDGRMMPFPRMIVGDVKHLKKIGVKGVVSQHGWPWAMNLNAYTLAKILWNPDLSASAILKEYCQRYGTAADDMEQYFTLMEQAMGSLHHPEALGDNWMGTPQTRMAKMNEFFTIFNKAEAQLRKAMKNKFSKLENKIMNREWDLFTWTKQTFVIQNEYAKARLLIEKNKLDEAKSLYRKIKSMSSGLREKTKKLDIDQNLIHKCYPWCSRDLKKRLKIK